MIYNALALREIFHLEFLRWLAKKIKPNNYALKDGTNLRFFFNSIRYSEDMDLDIVKGEVYVLQEVVMKILTSSSFLDNLRPFGIREVIPPNIAKAKQTETTQRFKIHLLSETGENLFTKVEFSRRGFRGKIVVESVPKVITRAYKIAPLLVPHYDICSAISQKINALATRRIIQARDIFDLYILSSQYSCNYPKKEDITKDDKAIFDEKKLTSAYANVFEISFEEFRDTVLAYLEPEDINLYKSEQVWDEIKLKVAEFINEIKETCG